MVEGGLDSVTIRARAEQRIPTRDKPAGDHPSDVAVDDPWLRYTLRSVRGGLVTSAFIIFVVTLYLKPIQIRGSRLFL